MLEVLEWARERNLRHPADLFRIIGLDPTSARPDDYAAVIDHAAQHDRQSADELRRHYEVIVSAHDLGEHLQRARGIHPGRRFVEHARDAYEVVVELPDSEANAAALTTAWRIVDFHATSLAEGFDYDAVRHRTVTTLTSLTADGTKVVYWDGLAFTANAPRLDPVALLEPFQSVGNGLRDRLGTGYLSLLIGFAHGDLGELHDGQRAHEPMFDSVDADLTVAGPERYLLDLRAPGPAEVVRWLHEPRRLRIIGGVYDAAADADHYLTTSALGEWFDAVIHAGPVTSTQLL